MSRGRVIGGQYLLGMPEVLHALRLTRTIDDVPLTVVTSRGQENVILHPFAAVQIMTGDTATLFNRRDRWIDVRDRSGRPDPLWLSHVGDVFHFEHVGNLLYVQVNTVGDTTDETLAHFAQRLHDEIASTKPEKVAIDLRLNRGGNGTLITPFIRAIIQSESIDRKSRLFAIIGPATFSAAQMFADALEKYTNVTFVGEPTGSKGNAYGDSRQIILPNSGMTVRVATYYWQDWHPMDQRDAIVPQVLAPLTFDAYRSNIDPALAAIERVPVAEPRR
jgi:C-terminal processing protease CtpA/Prc